MNRRGFLGFFGGAAVAGPKLASDIAANVSSSMPMPPMMGGYATNGSACNPVSDGDWRLTEIARLKKVISGKDPEAERNAKMNRLYSAENTERVRLDSLRSVSPAYKLQMLTDGAPKRQQRVSRAEAGFRLADFLRTN